jgi:hypothetical protein
MADDDTNCEPVRYNNNLYSTHLGAVVYGPTPSSGQTDLDTKSFTKKSQVGFWKLTLAGSISKVSRTSVSTTVRSP